MHHLCADASRAVLTAYTGSEEQGYRRPEKMKIQCGDHLVTINPYVWTPRRKSFADTCRIWDQRIGQLSS